MNISSSRFRRLAQFHPGPAFLLAVAGWALAACNGWETRAEFAPPQSRWPTSQPSSTAVNAPPPPVPVQYCYRTLATVDCFAEPKPERVTGYTGLYPNPDALKVIQLPPKPGAPAATADAQNRSAW
jgi:hypothetical protein